MNDGWRKGFRVGDKIPVSISGKPADVQTCIVTENDAHAVMRVKCDDFKEWKAGIHWLSEFQVRLSGKDAGPPANKPVAKPLGSSSTGLKVGEYACTGSGGRIMIGLSFKVLPGNRYTDLDGSRRGTFVVAGDKVTFRGGHLTGISGRDLRDNWFTVSAGARCGPYR